MDAHRINAFVFSHKVFERGEKEELWNGKSAFSILKTFPSHIASSATIAVSLSHD